MWNKLKKIILVIALLPAFAHADTKISAFTSTTSMNSADIIPVVINPGTTPTNRIITFQDFYNAIPSTISANSLGVLTTSSATATYVNVNQGLTQSSATATYLQSSSATATYLNLNLGLTQSSATATYLQKSSATATYLQLSSATATYLNKNQATNGTVTSVGASAPVTTTGGNTPTIGLSQTVGQPETFTSSVTVTASGGTGITYNVNVGSVTGANLSTCGDATHAVGYSATTGLFSCQNITGSGGSGGSSSLQVTNAGVEVTSPTASLNLVSPLSATAIGTTSQITLTVTSSGIAFGSASNTVTQDTATFTYNSTNKDLTVDAGLPVLIASTGSTNMGSAGFIVVHQGYAYVTAYSGNSLTVFDVSIPSAPVFLKQIVGTSGNPPYSTEGLEAAGNYLYMLNFGNPNGGNTLTVWDISAPANPTIVTNLTDATNLAQCEHIRIYGNYAYIADYATDGITKPGLTVVDISNPKAPFIAGTLTNANITHPIYIQIRYPYLYMTNESALGKANVIDISIPTSPVLKTSLVPQGETASGLLITNEIRGRYWYIADNGDGKLFTFDISSPTAPVQLSTVTFAESDLTTVKAAGNDLYITEQLSNKLYKLSLVNPSTPTIIGFLQDVNNLSRPDDLFLYDHYLFTSNHGTGACPQCGGFSVVDIGGFVVGGITAGTGQFDNLSVTHDVRTNRIMVDTSLTANIIGSPGQIYGSYFTAGSTLTISTFSAVSMTTATVTNQLTAGTFQGGNTTTGDLSLRTLTVSSGTILNGATFPNTGSSLIQQIVAKPGLGVGIGKSPALGSGSLDALGTISSDNSIQTNVFNGGYYTTLLTLRPITVMQSAGPNFGLIENDGTGVFDLGYGPSATALGTAVLKWDSSPAVNVISSMTVKGANGLNVTYNVNAGSVTGSGLTTCGDSTHALGYSASNLFTCQSVTGSGGGGASMLAVGTGTSTGFTGPITSSPTAVILLNSSQFSTSLQGGATAFVSALSSSFTLQGSLPTQLGTVTQGTWQGSVIDDTYLSPDVVYFDNPPTFTSSVTITAPQGLGVTYNVNVGSITGGGLSTCGDATHGLGFSGSNLFTCQSITGSGGGGGASALGVSSGSATNSIVVSSPTSNIVVDSNTFIASLQGSTSAFLQLNSSSVTLQGNNLGATYLTNSSATATYLNLNQGLTQSSATATYLNLNQGLTQSSATATYLQLSSATATYLNLNQGLTQSSATATYLQLSSATATYLQGSSATLTYVNVNQGLTQSSATTTYLQQSSATATYLQQSSATATYLQLSSATSVYLQKSSATATYGQLNATQTWTATQIYTSSAVIANNIQVTTFTVTGISAIPTNSQNGGKSTLNQWFSQMAAIQTPLLSPISANKLSFFVLADSHFSRQTISGPFTDWLYSNFGNAGTLFPLADDSQISNDRRPNGCTYSKSGTWVATGLTPSSLGFDDDTMHTSTPTATILGTCPGADTVILHYVVQPNGGTVNFSVDGGTAKVLNTAGTLTVASATISGLQYGVHTASVSYTTSGSAGIDVLDYVFFSSSTPGAVMYRVGAGGASAGTFVAQDPVQYEKLLNMLPSTPSVVMFGLGGIEAQLNVSTTTYIANIRNLVGRFRTVYPLIDCAYLSPPDSVADIIPSGSYATALLQAAVADQCAYLDFNTYFSSANYFNNFYTDGTHLNNTGGQVAAQIMINTFANNMSNITPFTYNASSSVVTVGNDQSTNTISNVAAFGSNIVISSGITNSGAIGTNLTVSSSNVFQIGGANGSGFEQNLIVATATVSAINVIGGGGVNVTYDVMASSMALSNSTSPTTLFVSTSPTGVAQLSVSSTIAVSPSDALLSISSTSGTTILWVNNAGNLISSGTTTTVTSCGTSPSVAGNNIAGQITVGGGVVTACTLNFANGGFLAPPICVFADNSTTVNPSLGATSNTSVVINLSATLGGGLINYLCVGYQR